MKSRSRHVTRGPRTLRAWVEAQPRRLRQQDLAAMLGISPSLLSQLIGAHPKPCGRATALRLHRLTGVPLEALLDPPGDRA